MSTSIVSFDFKSMAVRTVTDEKGEVLFVGKDVCEILGYSNPSDAMKQHCRGVAKYYPIQDSIGRTQEARVLSEPDVMRLIVSCKLPADAWLEVYAIDIKKIIVETFSQ